VLISGDLELLTS